MPRARIVYSYIAHRSKQPKACSAAEVMQYVGVHRSSTLPKIIGQLEELGLIESDAGGFRGLPPVPGWFVARESDSEHWSTRLAGFRLYSLSEESRLTLIQNMVLWTLHSLSRDGVRVAGQSKAGLAKMVGASWPTVHEAIRVLEGCGHMKVLGGAQDRLYLGLYRPSYDLLVLLR